MGFQGPGRGNEYDFIGIGTVTGGDEERIRAAVRHGLLGEGWREIEFAFRSEIIPIGERPVGGASGGDNVLTKLRFEGDQVAAMPGRKEPALVLALIPISIHGL